MPAQAERFCRDGDIVLISLAMGRESVAQGIAAAVSKAVGAPRAASP
jgi:hypothetical protein